MENQVYLSKAVDFRIRRLLTEYLRGKITEFMSRTKALRSRAIEYYRIFKGATLFSTQRKIIMGMCVLYDRLVQSIQEIFKADPSVQSFPLKLKKYASEREEDLLDIIAYLDQIIGFLEGKRA